MFLIGVAVRFSRSPGAKTHEETSDETESVNVTKHNVDFCLVLVV